MATGTYESTLEEPLGPVQDQSQFRYEPLNNSSDTIRLIEVLPASQDGQIRVRMTQSCMDTEYWCLSYMWGSGAEFEILVNDSPMKVRENLHGFLETAQQRYCGRHLWIDALCINQQDYIERNQQVQQMGQIYQKAQEVLIWLGEAQMDHIFDAAEQITPLCRRYALPEEMESLLQPRLQDIGVELSKLYAHPYWNRTWITQEILLARRLRLVCKSGELDNDHLNNLLEEVSATMYSRSSCSAPYQSLIASIMYRYWHRNKQWWASAVEFWTILEWLKDTDCGDRRDHIYGLLSLVEGGFDFEVKYDEDALLLVCRAWKHFDAQGKPQYLKQLSYALKLTSEELKAYVASSTLPKPSLTLALRLHTVCGAGTSFVEESEWMGGCETCREEERNPSNSGIALFEIDEWGSSSNPTLHVIMLQKQDGTHTMIMHNSQFDMYTCTRFVLDTTTLTRDESDSWKKASGDDVFAEKNAAKKMARRYGAMGGIDEKRSSNLLRPVVAGPVPG